MAVQLVQFAPSGNGTRLKRITPVSSLFDVQIPPHHQSLLTEAGVFWLLISLPILMSLVNRSLLDCDPFGVIAINDATPPFICALFGNDAQATAGVTQDIQECCSPYFPAEYTTGNGCDHHWCGVPAYEAKGTDTSTWLVVPFPTEGTVRSTVTSTTTQTYDAIVAYPKVSSCLSSVALWNEYAFACRVGGELGEVSMTGPDPMSTTPTATVELRSTGSGSGSVAATGVSRSAAFTNGPFIWLLFGTLLLSF